MGGSKLVQKSCPKLLFEKYNQLKGEENTINLVTNFKTKKVTPGPFGNVTSNFNNILFLFEIESVFRVLWVEGSKSLKYLFKKVFFESMFHFVILSYVLGKNVLPVLAI